ncbi:EAL domain-containing protein [Duganella sp. sic0402]|uniref:putative bifunctional diguanylate cyclase/phosphodiesterase n=1 Tax=Duganella sp. sic0402 TaxID=2854786 RepID=UPI001C46664B|nr:GGDEF domain-containing phosphodiesterase [Duganella sp. sic0402]MBV7535149.1 EAL domain-containing protein [Duganella sp. sic0402]
MDTIVPELPGLPAFAGHAAPYATLDGEPAPAYFNALYLLAPVGYFVLSFDATILQMNVVGADLLALPRANPERAALREFIAPRFHGDFDRFLRRAISSGQPEHCNLQLLAPRGLGPQGVPVSLCASLDSSGQAVRVLLEPAEGKLAALERSEERFRHIVHNAAEGVWEIDATARTSFVNPRMAQMLGYAIEEMLGQPLVAFMDEEGRAILERNIARHQQGQAERHEFKFLRKDGSGLWATLAINPLFDASGAYRGALALVSDITTSRATEKLIWQQANFDALTTLPNRHMLLERVAQEMKRSRREEAPLALLCIGLDGVREVSDTLGRQQGDALLVEAARRIGLCVRTSDAVARLDGDAFCVILCGLEQVSSIDRIVQNLLAMLNRPFTLGTAQAAMSASIGIALYPDDAADADALLGNAGQAMHAARQGGGNRYSYFTDDLQLAAQLRQQMTLDLRCALQQRQFELHYQPIVNLRSGKIERAEALLRWRHPQRGLLAPAAFLPYAESGGLMLEIGDWVFRQASAQARHWQDELGAGFQVSVNQSLAQLRGDTAMYVEWLRHAASLGLPPRSIMLEISESALLDGAARTTERLRELREMGLQVALDNFGAGYASLSHLKHCGIDQLKLDHSLIQHLASDSGDLAICEALIVMAHKLGLRVVAEGVETATQSGLLVMMDCDYAQGYVFAGALPADEFGALARRGLQLLH